MEQVRLVNRFSHACMEWRVMIRSTDCWLICHFEEARKLVPMWSQVCMPPARGIATLACCFRPCTHAALVPALPAHRHALPSRPLARLDTHAVILETCFGTCATHRRSAPRVVATSLRPTVPPRPWAVPDRTARPRHCRLCVLYASSSCTCTPCQAPPRCCGAACGSPRSRPLQP
jgi:hypothetical protein